MGDLYWGIALALGLFWAVGAYNRLVRLRGEVIRQWSSVDAVWLRLLVRLQGGIAARQSLATEQDTFELQTLQSACDDLLEALTQARLQPTFALGRRDPHDAPDRSRGGQTGSGSRAQPHAPNLAGGPGALPRCRQRLQRCACHASCGLVGQGLEPESRHQTGLVGRFGLNFS
jgi:hypothetical protein